MCIDVAWKQQNKFSFTDVDFNIEKNYINYYYFIISYRETGMLRGFLRHILIHH